MQLTMTGVQFSVILTAIAVWATLFLRSRYKRGKIRRLTVFVLAAAAFGMPVTCMLVGSVSSVTFSPLGWIVALPGLFILFLGVSFVPFGTLGLIANLVPNSEKLELQSSQILGCGKHARSQESPLAASSARRRWRLRDASTLLAFLLVSGWLSTGYFTLKEGRLPALTDQPVVTVALYAVMPIMECAERLSHPDGTDRAL